MITLAGVSLAVSAQQPAQERWPRQQPMLDAAGHVRDDAFIRTPLLAGDEKYGDIDGWKMKDVVREIAALSRQTRDDKTRYWGRISGTRGEELAADWVEARFKKAGLTVSRRDFPLPPQWFPVDWSISFESGGRTHGVTSALPALRSRPTPSGGIDLDLVWVGTGTAADFAGRDVKGKAVLIHSIPAPGSMGHSASYEGAIRRAQDKGAAAVGVVYGMTDNFSIWQALGTAAAPITIPGFYIGWEDGKKLRDLLGEGNAVRLKMRLAIEERSGLKSQSVYGVLPGTTDEEIIVMAHMDGYFEAALDNASGMSVMIALLDHFAKVPQAQRRRSIRFIGQAGHHTGSLGSRYLHDNRATELAKTVLSINCEHVSVADHKYWVVSGAPDLRVSTVVAPRRWWVYGSDKLVNLTLDSYRRFNLGIIGDMDPSSTGEMSVMARDVPSLQVIRSPITKHTAQDTPEWVPAVGLEQVGRAFARVIDEANKLTRAELLPAPRSTSDAPRR
jgi:Zn-dependent M28 family amino/carboxypeptidase